MKYQQQLKGMFLCVKLLTWLVGRVVMLRVIVVVFHCLYSTCSVATFSCCMSMGMGRPT